MSLFQLEHAGESLFLAVLALLWAAARNDLALDLSICAGLARLLEGTRARGGFRGS